MNNNGKNHTGVVYFAHGKESGPWGTKISKLAQIARTKGFLVESPDYSKIVSPEQRVEKLLSLCCDARPENLILVGSSMGGYVATIASETLFPRGLFLMAPALYIEGYAQQNPHPNAILTAIIHGWNDEVIPVEHSIAFAQRHNAELHIIDGDHRLRTQLPFLQAIFGNFLDRSKLLIGQTLK